MPGTIEFRYDTDHEILFATVRWDISTEEDVRAWYAQWESYLKAEGLERVDCIVDVNELRVDPKIGKHWGQYRALLNKNYTRFSFRVHQNATVRTFTNTSGVLYGTATAEAKTMEDAIAGIQLARKQQEQGLLSDFPKQVMIRRARS